MQLVDIVLHVDKSLGLLIQQYGAWVYVLLFAIVFAETGLVVLPFLPGDTLLFIAGAMCATGQMDAWLLIVLLVIAATTGNTVNYFVGSWIGPRYSTVTSASLITKRCSGPTPFTNATAARRS